MAYVTDFDSKEDKLGFVSDILLQFWPGISSEGYHVDSAHRDI